MVAGRFCVGKRSQGGKPEIAEVYPWLGVRLWPGGMLCCRQQLHLVDKRSIWQLHVILELYFIAAR